jgi:hypothetical protein
LKAIDKFGNKFELSAPVRTRHRVDKIGSKPLALKKKCCALKFRLSPNPAAGATEIYTSDLHVQAIEVR